MFNGTKDMNDIDEILQFSTPKKTPGKTPRKTPSGDRFIPNRSAIDVESAHYQMFKENADAEGSGGPNSAPSTPQQDEYRRSVSETILDGNDAKRILHFKNKPPEPKDGYQNNLRVLYTQNQVSDAQRRKVNRHIPQNPEKILDAPELIDDYYLNLLDWSSRNVLAVALSDTVYLWNADSGDIQELMRTTGDGDYITSLQWTADGGHIAVGTNLADVQLWDPENNRQVRSLRGHRNRVASLSWNNYILSSGSRDSAIINHDVRIRDHAVATLNGHTQEVCGLKWSPNGSLLASGGNDNLLNIWDARSTSPKFTLDRHTAAVKALAWCPFQTNVLASGGGTADRHLRFWNAQTGACLNEIDTRSQVCSIVWSKYDRELVTSHGFTQNQLTLWKYPSMVKMAELTGHTSRVLHLAQSPDGSTVVSAAGDETIRFWKVFGEPPKTVSKKTTASAASGSLRQLSIR